MSKLFSAFTERRIWRVLVAYPGVTFIWLQAVEFFINNYQLDSRLLTASIIAAVVLFPAAVVWNWRHGEVGEQDFSRPEIGAYTLFAIAAVASVAWYWKNRPSGKPFESADHADQVSSGLATFPMRTVIRSSRSGTPA